ncbi:MAG: glycosyltransferase [Acidimicrobiia bacterium]
MRVLQVHTRYRQPGGEDTVVEAEAGVLRAAGHHVVQYQAENPPKDGAAATALALSAWNPWAARRLQAVAEEAGPDLAHVHNTWYALSASILRALRRLGIPVVMTLHNYRLMCSNALLFRDGRPCEDCVGTHPWHGVVHRCYRGSVLASTAGATAIALHQGLHTWERDVELFLALTEFARGRFIAGGLSAERIRVKPNFVPDPGRRPRPPSASATLLFVGRLSPEKGIDRLLDVWEGLPHHPFELVVVGDGPLRPALEARAVPGVRLTGPLDQEEVGSWMREARALVFPSLWYEAQPLVVLEALAGGLPVLGSELGAVPELLEELGPGWTVPPQAGAWAEALRGLEDDREVEEASRRARATYEARFTPQAGLAQLEAAYASVLG